MPDLTRCAPPPFGCGQKSAMNYAHAAGAHCLKCHKRICLASRVGAVS